MTAFDNIKVNNWPSTSNEFEDFLVLELPLNEAASLTESRRDIVVSGTVLHQKATLTNNNETKANAPGDTHALVFRGAGAPKKHLEDNTQTNGSFYSQSNHYDANDASTHHWDWTFTPPIPNVTNVKVNSRHLNQHFNPYYYQVYDENNNAQVATPVDKASVTTDTEIYAGNAFNLKRIKMYGGAGGDDFFKIIINGVTLNQNNGIGTVTEDATHTASTTYKLGIPKKHYDTNAVFANSFLSTTAPVPRGGESRTLEFWAYMNSGASSWQNIIAYGSSSASKCFGINRGNSDSSNIAFTGYSGGDWDTGVSVASYLDTWTHFSVSYESGVVEIFLNGVSIGTANRTLDTGGSNFVIGASEHSGNSERFDGAIQDVRVYNKKIRTGNFTPPGAILS